MPARAALLDVDVRLARGDFTLAARAAIGSGVTGICGASGAGKSTLLAIIAGLLRPQQGRVCFADTRLNDTADDVFVPPWQRHFGLVFQDAQLFPHLSVRGNLLYGWKRLPPRERRLDLDSVAALLEIRSLLARRPAQLSGGERQRVALGRALLYCPRMLLLDEPLSALDARLKQQILPFLRRIKSETGVPMLYVSHAMDEVEYLADRVLWMDQGQLADRPATAPVPESRSTP